jgi:hypothetical protein
VLALSLNPSTKKKKKKRTLQERKNGPNVVTLAYWHASNPSIWAAEAGWTVRGQPGPQGSCLKKARAGDLAQ